MRATLAAPKLADLAAVDRCSTPPTADEPEGTASFRLFSDRLSAAEMMRLFDRAPDRSYEQGDPISPRNPARTRKEAFCQWDSGLPRSLPPAAHVEVIARFTERCQTALASLVGSAEMGWFCSQHRHGGRGGLFIPARLLAAFRLLPLQLFLDLYAPERPDATTADDDWIPRRTFVHLRIVSTSVSAAEMTAKLGIAPSWRCERGDHTRPDRLPLDGAVWLLDSGMDPEADDWSALDTFAAFFDEHQAALWSLAAHARISLRIVQASEWQAGVIVPPSTTCRLFQVPIDLAYVVYRADQLPPEDIVLFD